MLINIIERFTFYIGLFGYVVIYWGILKSLYLFFQAELYKRQDVHNKSLDQIRLMLGKYLSFFLNRDIKLLTSKEQ